MRATLLMNGVWVLNCPESYVFTTINYASISGKCLTPDSGISKYLSLDFNKRIASSLRCLISEESLSNLWTTSNSRPSAGFQATSRFAKSFKSGVGHFRSLRLLAEGSKGRLEFAIKTLWNSKGTCLDNEGRTTDEVPAEWRRDEFGTAA